MHSPRLNEHGQNAEFPWGNAGGPWSFQCCTDQCPQTGKACLISLCSARKATTLFPTCRSPLLENVYCPFAWPERSAVKLRRISCSGSTGHWTLNQIRALAIPRVGRGVDRCPEGVKSAPRSICITCKLTGKTNFQCEEVVEMVLHFSHSTYYHEIFIG